MKNEYFEFFKKIVDWIRFDVLALFLLFLISAIIYLPSSLKDRTHIRKEKTRLKKRIKINKEINKKLEYAINKVKTDPVCMEMILRKHLRITAPGEEFLEINNE